MLKRTRDSYKDWLDGWCLWLVHSSTSNNNDTDGKTDSSRTPSIFHLTTCRANQSTSYATHADRLLLGTRSTTTYRKTNTCLGFTLWCWCCGTHCWSSGYCQGKGKEKKKRAFFGCKLNTSVTLANRALSHRSSTPLLVISETDTTIETKSCQNWTTRCAYTFRKRLD